jgi:DNA replication protein DnaC
VLVGARVLSTAARPTAGARGRFFNVVDLVNKLEAEARSGRAGRLAEHLMRLDFVVLDELGYLPFAQSGGQLLFHLISKLDGSINSTFADFDTSISMVGS